jgi:hypothetical protein
MSVNATTTVSTSPVATSSRSSSALSIARSYSDFRRSRGHAGAENR